MKSKAHAIGIQQAALKQTTVRTPRWVKMFGIIAIVLAVLFVGLHLTGHGFGSHAHSSFAARGVQPP